MQTIKSMKDVYPISVEEVYRVTVPSMDSHKNHPVGKVI